MGPTHRTIYFGRSTLNSVYVTTNGRDSPDQYAAGLLR